MHDNPSIATVTVNKHLLSVHYNENISTARNTKNLKTADV